MDADPRLAKVRKLLAKAEGASTPEEAESYNTKAAELIAKWGIDAAMAAVTEPTRDKITDRKIVLDQPYARDKADLLWAITNPLRIKAVMLTGKGYDARGRSKNTYTMHLFGFASDMERAEVLFTSLLLQAHTDLYRQEIPYGEDRDAYRRSWLVGFSSAVSRRLWAAERKAQDEASDAAPGVALVLVDRKTLAERAMNDYYPRLSHSRRSLTGSGAGSGYQAGQRANLGGTGLGRRSAGAIR